MVLPNITIFIIVYSWRKTSWAISIITKRNDYLAHRPCYYYPVCNYLFILNFNCWCVSIGGECVCVEWYSADVRLVFRGPEDESPKTTNRETRDEVITHFSYNIGYWLRIRVESVSNIISILQIISGEVSHLLFNRIMF